MKTHLFALSGLLCLMVLCALPLSPNVQAQGNPGGEYTIDGIPDTGQFLPGDFVLARVEKREVTVAEFVDRYFNSLIQFRPPTTLEGRQEFLEGMVNKEILALVAKEANRPLEFEDRLVLREQESRVLSNVLYQRMVYDSITISDEDIAEVYKQYQRSVRLRHIQFSSKQEAWEVRKLLLAGDVDWETAVRKYSQAPDVETNPDGDLGLKLRIGADAIQAMTIFTLEKGEISEPVIDQDGVHLLQCVDIVPYAAPSLNSMRGSIRDDIIRVRSVALSDRFMRRLAMIAEMTYDSALVRQVAGAMGDQGISMSGRSINVDAHIPEFAPEDTSRVLARWNTGLLTLGGFLERFESIPPIARPPINTFDAVIAQIHGATLEPQRVRLARELDLDKDPAAVAQMDRRLEQLRVEHMFQDSILTVIWIDPEERRAFYESNLAAYISFPKARYARFHLERRSLADSIKAMLDSGTDAQTIIDSGILPSHSSGEIGDRSQNDTEGDRKLLFEELEEGEVTIIGPDGHGHFSLLQLIALDPGHQMAFEEVQDLVDESLRNMRAEERLNELIDRHRSRFDIEVHPEMLMRVRLVDPMLWSE